MKNKGDLFTVIIPFDQTQKGNAFLFFQNNIESLDAQRQWQHICGIKQSLYVESYIIIVACCRCVWIFSLKLYESPSSEG